jgi:hypothetical protein
MVALAVEGRRYRVYPAPFVLVHETLPYFARDLGTVGKICNVKSQSLLLERGCILLATSLISTQRVGWSDGCCTILDFLK